MESTLPVLGTEERGLGVVVATGRCSPRPLRRDICATLGILLPPDAERQLLRGVSGLRMMSALKKSKPVTQREARSWDVT